MPEIPDTPMSYLARLKLWAIYTAAGLVAMILHALILKWIGTAPNIMPPPPPVIIVNPSDQPLNVQIHRP